MSLVFYVVFTCCFHLCFMLSWFCTCACCLCCSSMFIMLFMLLMLFFMLFSRCSYSSCCGLDIQETTYCQHQFKFVAHNIYTYIYIYIYIYGAGHCGRYVSNTVASKLWKLSLLLDLFVQRQARNSKDQTLAWQKYWIV